jgi:ubiquinone/menaquinone biosynthesis C-methylase UbiE
MGLDYAIGGNRLARKLAATAPSRTSFLTGEITALPFCNGCFDGFLAVLVLDNVTRSRGEHAVRELDRVTRAGAPGFVVLNPWPMPAASETAENPTSACTRYDYGDEEALRLLSGWAILSWRRAEHGLRVFHVRR